MPYKNPHENNYFAPDSEEERELEFHNFSSVNRGFDARK
jgi:hypothetical protein